MRTEIKNAVITSATLCAERGSFLSSWLHLDYGDNSSQGFGGFALYLDKTTTHHSKLSYAGHWIWRVMDIAGVEDWAHLKGRTIRVRAEDDRIEAIGHIVRDEWFCPREEFKQ